MGSERDVSDEEDRKIMTATTLAILIYAALVALGGIYGYAKAQSVPSLVAGIGAGVVLVGSAIAMMRGAYQVGWWISLVVALLLLARFAFASFKSFKWMPGGLMIILSLAAIIMLLIGRRGPGA